tara:strand:- start:82 stop:357 length:276 start_codon:yes stop_codon:yes gene_type:complete
MNKVVVILASVLLVVSGFMSFIRNLMLPPCSESRKKKCVIHKYVKSNGIVDEDSHKSYKDMNIIRVIHSVIMIIFGFLLFLAKSKMQKFLY